MIDEVMNMTKRITLFAVLLLAMAGARAQDGSGEDKAMPMNHGGADHGAMAGNGDGNTDGNMHGDHTMPMGDGGDTAMDGNMNMDGDMAMDMDMSGMQGGEPPADARGPDYSEGVDFFRHPKPKMADEETFSMLAFDRLENTVSHGNSVLTWDMQAWYGYDFDRAVIKSEGDYDNGSVEEASTDLLWSHAVSGFWNRQLGVRYDTGEAPDRGWLAFGFQGLAPYWFEVDATGYVGEHGQTAFSLEAEYDLRLTQRWILQPRLEANLYGKTEPEFGLGSGLNDLTTGLRLQYQFRREITAYAGVQWVNLFGNGKDLARAEGGDGSDTRFVAGMRLWF